MLGPGMRHLLEYSNNRTYSPIILNNDWPTLWRLIFIVLFSFTGTIINGFFVSSFFITNNLKKAGFVYLACTGLSDMIMTTGVMPAAAVVMISQVWEGAAVCYALQFLAQTATYSYSLLFSMVAIETYMRLCRTRASYEQFLSIPVWLVSLMIFIVSFTVSAAGVYLGMDYDYCTRETYGNYTFRLITSLTFHGLPFALTVIFLVSTSLVVRARAIRLVNYKRSQQYDRDYAFTNLNIGCYFLYVAAWIPYLIIVHQYPNTHDSNFYNCVWLGLFRSIITSFLYSGLNNNFRHAFAHLFYYCCCKSALNTPFNNRHRRASEYKFPGEVCVHIMHHSMLANPPRARPAGCSKDDARYTCEI